MMDSSHRSKNNLKIFIKYCHCVELGRCKKLRFGWVLSRAARWWTTFFRAKPVYCKSAAQEACFDHCGFSAVVEKVFILMNAETESGITFCFNNCPFFFLAYWRAPKMHPGPLGRSVYAMGFKLAPNGPPCLCLSLSTLEAIRGGALGWS